MIPSKMSKIDSLTLQKEVSALDLSSIVCTVNTSVNDVLLEPIVTTTKAEIKTDNKCHLCRRKTGLLGFKCSCGGNYCAKHRFMDQHMCVNESEQIKKDLEYLEKQNIRIIANKIDKI